jgi:hypothetical protein
MTSDYQILGRFYFVLQQTFFSIIVFLLHFSSPSLSHFYPPPSVYLPPLGSTHRVHALRRAKREGSYAYEARKVSMHLWRLYGFCSYYLSHFSALVLQPVFCLN